MSQLGSLLRIRLLNVILNYIYSRGWTNYDNFADDFVDSIVEEFSDGVFDARRILRKCSPTFFRLNSINMDEFLSDELWRRVMVVWRTTGEGFVRALSFGDVFPEIASVLDREVESVAANLDVPEDKLQQALRDALREKGASPYPEGERIAASRSRMLSISTLT
jgi:hypothetical protein